MSRRTKSKKDNLNAPFRGARAHNAKPSAAPADAPRRTHAPDAENPDAYKFASYRYRRDRAIPARRANRRTIRAHGSRTNDAISADTRASTRLGLSRDASISDARRRV